MNGLDKMKKNRKMSSEHFPKLYVKSLENK